MSSIEIALSSAVGMREPDAAVKSSTSVLNIVSAMPPERTKVMLAAVSLAISPVATRPDFNAITYGV